LAAAAAESGAESTAGSTAESTAGSVESVGHLLRPDENDSLSYWISSPERYAERLHMTAEQVLAIQTEHAAASTALHKRISDLPAAQGKLKHQLICQHRYQYGKHPFVCRSCWCYQPVCLCRMAAAQEEMQASLPFCVDQVVLWTHHREWTSISNSGSLLPLLLKNVTLLMKGLPEHDTKMNELLVHDPQRIIVVLWPDNDISTRQNHSNTTITNRKTWQQIQEMVIDGSKKITLLAVEGTWRTARRMESKLPPHVIRVKLPPETVYWRSNDADHTVKNEKGRSLLAELRQQDGGPKDNLCTAEAVTAALVGLGLPKDQGNGVLEFIQHKVDRIRRYQGKQKRS